MSDIMDEINKKISETRRELALMQVEREEKEIKDLEDYIEELQQMVVDERLAYRKMEFAKNEEIEKLKEGLCAGIFVLTLSLSFNLIFVSI